MSHVQFALGVCTFLSSAATFAGWCIGVLVVQDRREAFVLTDMVGNALIARGCVVGLEEVAIDGEIVVELALLRGRGSRCPGIAFLVGDVTTDVIFIVDGRFGPTTIEAKSAFVSYSAYMKFVPQTPTATNTARRWSG